MDHIAHDPAGQRELQTSWNLRNLHPRHPQTAFRSWLQRVGHWRHSAA